MTKRSREYLGRDTLTTKAHLRRKEVDVPEVGVILIQEFTAQQRVAYAEYIEVGDDGLPKFGIGKQVRMGKFLMSLGCINEDGSPMFKDIDDVPDIRVDAEGSISMAILQLSGIIPAEVKDNLPNVKGTPTLPSPVNSDGTSQISVPTSILDGTSTSTE